MAAQRMFDRRSVLKVGLLAVPIAASSRYWLSGNALQSQPVQKTTSIKLQSFVDTFVLGSTKPDATNTGVPAGTALTDVAGNYTANVAGATITGKRFLGYVYVRAANVTFRNCRFSGPAAYGYVTSALADCRSVTALNTVFDRCTFRCRNITMYWLNAITVQSGAKVLINRCDISYTSDGVNGGDAAGSVVKMRGNYVHDLLFFNNSRDHATDYYHPYWEHNDGVQLSGGSGHEINGNFFKTYAVLGVNDGAHGLPAVDPSTGSWNRRYGAGITISPDKGLVTNTVIKNNWFEGGTASLQMSSSKSAGVNFGTIGSNRFGMDQYNYGSRSRYQVRYKTGAIIAGTTTNYFDPAAVSVPAAMKSKAFSVGFTGGIRLD